MKGWGTGKQTTRHHSRKSTYQAHPARIMPLTYLFINLGDR